MEVYQNFKKTYDQAAQLACQYAESKANADLEDSDEKCLSCDGTGIMITTWKTFGKDDETKDKMTCFKCKGTGKVSRHKKFNQLVYQHLWCKCKESDDQFHAKDGHEVFGNDTYICMNCGLVTQFG